MTAIVTLNEYIFAEYLAAAALAVSVPAGSESRKQRFLGPLPPIF